MASVGGTRSYLASSDEVFQNACGPCKDEGKTKEAKYFCEICKEDLCFDCRNDHQTFKGTKNHSVVSTSSTATRGTFEIVCGCEQRQAVKVYCEKHAEVICPICETIKHRNCETCPIKDKVTKDTEKELQELMYKVKSLKAAMENAKKEGEVNRMELEDRKEECKNEIAAFRREINELIDKKETEILEILEKNSNQILQAIEKQITAMVASLKALNTNIDIINNAFKTKKDEHMFSANVKFLKSLSEYDALIQDIKNGMQVPNLKFQQKKELTDLLKSREGFGRIDISEADSSQRCQVILDMKVESKKEVKIQSSDDDLTPQITGCAFLSNGHILLCDYNNNKVKLLDSDMSIKKQMKLSDEPNTVAVVDENEAIITFDNGKKFQYIYIHPDFKLGKKIKLKGKCQGLLVVNDEIYTTFQKDSGLDELWRLDRAGKIINKVSLQNSSCASEYLGICLGSSIPLVYLTGRQNGVTCFRVDGEMVFQYQSDELKGSKGIYVDSVGNSFVCGTQSHNVVVITDDGRKHGELLTSKDIAKPMCIDYRPEDDTLIVGCVNSPNLFVCKLGK